MMIRLGNSWADVVHGDEEEIEWLRSYLSYPNKEAKYQERALRQKGIDREVPETLSLLRRVGRMRLQSGQVATGFRFPAGILPLVNQDLPMGKTLDVMDTRNGVPDVDFSVLDGEPWNMAGNYAHQKEAITAWWEGSAMKSPGRGIVWAPTGSGKGRIAAAIPAMIPGRWMFAVHRGHLVDDVRSRFESLTGERAGRIGDGEWEVRRFTCATLQSLHAHFASAEFNELAEKTDGIIVDECHVAPAGTFHRTIQSFRNARFRMGLSGTPLDRSDRRSLVAIGSIGPVVYRVRASTLQKRGILAVRATPTCTGLGGRSTAKPSCARKKETEPL